MVLYRHIPFLKEVFKYAVTAFGGPQGHIGMMMKSFVEKRNDVSKEELVEYMSFCQMLPGPSSTQTITLIGYKRGGVPLAILTFLIWILPACSAMCSLALVVYYVGTKNIQTHIFHYIQPMAVGFLAFAAFKSMRISVNNTITYVLMLFAIMITFFIRNPYVFPILIVIGGIATNFSNKRIPDTVKNKKPIKWVNLWWFVIVFLLAGTLSEFARINHWTHARLFNLFENFYRFGSIVFGGGHALLPLMYQQFVIRPESLHIQPYLTTSEFLTGAGIVNAIPGPVFSICTYISTISMSSFGITGMILGGIVGTLAVFSPSILILFFFFPLYQNLKQHVIIFRALEGIHAVIVGIMWASGFILLTSVPFDWTNIVVVIITFSMLMYTNIPAPVIVLAWLILGLAMQ